jgi:hypothetical protein
LAVPEIVAGDGPGGGDDGVSVGNTLAGGAAARGDKDAADEC